MFLKKSKSSICRDSPFPVYRVLCRRPGDICTFGMSISIWNGNPSQGTCRYFALLEVVGIGYLKKAFFYFFLV